MLVLSLVLGVASAIAYGCSTAVQHAAAYHGGEETDARGLLALLRNVRWWLSIGGDGVGLVLQVAALATGPVVLVQPLQVLSLPVALPIRSRLGGPKPTARDWVAVGAVVAGLAGFLVLVGDPGDPRRHHLSTTLIAAVVALAVGGAVALVALRTQRVLRAALFGAVSGGLFAVVAVLVDEIAARFENRGWEALARLDGWLLLVAVLLVGGFAVVLTQAAFQVGQLGASFTSSVITDPVLAVVLGAVVLGERVPLDPGHLVGYLVALAVVAAGTIALANPRVPAPLASATTGAVGDGPVA